MNKISDIRLKGKILPRLEKALKTLLSQEIYSDDYLMATLSFENIQLAHYPEYSGDVPGRWILAMTAMEKIFGKQPRLHQFVQAAIKYQRRDGHFGREEQPLTMTNRAQIYGNAWMLQGLMSYYKHSRNPEVLDSARRMGDYYLQTEEFWINDFEINKPVTYGHGFGCFTHVLEAMVMLYEETREQKYLKLAEKIASVTDAFDKAVHSHMHLSTLRGFLALYKINRDDRLLQRVIEENRMVIEHEMLETGGVYECYGIHYIDEACSVCDFFLVNLRLWKITGNNEYRLCAEKAFWNHLLFSQFPEGSFGSLPVNPEFLDKNAVPAYWCCAMYGANVLAAYPEESVFIVDNEITVSLLFSGEFTVKINQAPVSITIDADYLRNSVIKVKVDALEPITVKLRIYLPANTQVISPPQTTDYIELHLDNSSQAEFELKIRNLLRYEAAETILSPDGKFKILQDANFYWGPHMLCQYSPMLKKRGHFLLIAEKADSTFEFVDVANHTIMNPLFDAPFKANYMRLIGDEIGENINSKDDIFQTDMCLVGDFAGERCKVSFDVVVIPFEQVKKIFKND
jgi:hypothetical protein